MSTLTIHVEVNAPVEKAFQVFTDLEHAADRIPGITKLELLTEGPVSEGTRWRETRMMFKKEAVEEMWITGFTPPHSYTVEANSHGMLYQTLFEFSASGSGTGVTWTFKSTPQTFGTKVSAPILGLLFNGFLKKCLREDMEALKVACEA